MRNFLLLSLCMALLGPPLLAQASADLEVTSVTVDKTTAATGELVSFTATVRNNGPAAAQNVIVRFGERQLPLTLEAPAGWTCRRFVSDSPAGTCTATTLAAGAQATFSGTVLAPRNTAGFAMGVQVFISATTNDTLPDNNRRFPRFTHVAASNHADLSARVTPRGGTREGTEGIVDVAITNHGPAAAQNVVVAIDTRDETPLINPGAEGTGWTCTNSLQGLLCRTPLIPANGTAAFVVRFTAPAEEGTVEVGALPQAEMSIDTVWRNDFAVGYAGIGSAENWRRVMLPLVAEVILGANGAQWRTDVMMMIRSDEHIQLWPGPCDRMVDPCFEVPRQVPVSIDWLLQPEFEGRGRFVYVRPEDEQKLHFNTRVWDAARFSETAGAEIPAVREDEFHTFTISLLSIPVAPQYRHTLRVYDADARENARVMIHVYAGQEATPRVSVVRSLARSPQLVTLTNAMLPSHPGYLELNPAELLPLAGLQTIRIDIEPVDPGLRFWGFVSVTNNETHHVTTVTPQ